ncbi:MAG: choline monooxygenase [Pseudohongiellaceae bacterium]|jgi:choline monooxygenase
MDHHALAAEVQRFDSSLPIERALTPPSSWYQGQDFFELDRSDVFAKQWVVAGRLDDLQEPGSFVTGDTMGWPWFVVRDTDGELRGFHNACRHHATVLLKGVGQCERIVCPYHGWSYGLDGALATAPHMAGVADFDRGSMGLAPLGLRTWRRWVFLRVDGPPGAGVAPVAEDQAFTAELARIDTELQRLGADELVFHGQRSYQVQCNWKVFVDNYLDGGYHVPQLHKQLSSRLDLDGYATELLTRSVLQTCPAKTGSGRLGPGALYAWLHPNLCINRYGDVMDVNIIRPLGPELTEVIFEDYRHPQMTVAAMTLHLDESERVQQEDMDISRSVQIGLGSPGYDRGRYSPGLEGGEHLFHQMLRAAYDAGLAEAGEAKSTGR